MPDVTSAAGPIHLGMDASCQHDRGGHSIHAAPARPGFRRAKFTHPFQRRNHASEGRSSQAPCSVLLRYADQFPGDSAPRRHDLQALSHLLQYPNILCRSRDAEPDPCAVAMVGRPGELDHLDGPAAARTVTSAAMPENDGAGQSHYASRPEWIRNGFTPGCG